MQGTEDRSAYYVQIVRPTAEHFRFRGPFQATTDDEAIAEAGRITREQHAGFAVGKVFREVT